MSADKEGNVHALAFSSDGLGMTSKDFGWIFQKCADAEAKELDSLAQGSKGDFGNEAINTIVQEMENNRDDTIVVFAGYPEAKKPVSIGFRC